MATLGLLATGSVRADGPHIAFHATTGPYTVTLFSAPDPLVTGPVELTLLVQNAQDGSLSRSASARGDLVLPSQAPIQFFMKQLNEKGAPDVKLPHATAQLKIPGKYALMLWVGASGTVEVRFAGSLSVETNHGKRNSVLWALFLPILLVLLFLANQYAKQQLKRRGKPLVS